MFSCNDKISLWISKPNQCFKVTTRLKKSENTKIFRACDCVLGTKQLGVQKTKTQTAIVIKLRLR